MKNLHQTQLKCASDLLDVLPWIRHYLRTIIREQPQVTITLQEVRVLARLRRFPNLTLSLLAEELAVNKATASLIVGRMVKQGLVIREKNPQRKREIVLNPTPMGLRQLENTLRLLQENLALQMEGFSFEELQALEAGLGTIRKILKNLYPNVQSIQ